MSKTFIIAEAGINHNGKLSLAKKLAYVSKHAGADVVKYQTFWDIGRLEEYELTKEEFIELKEYCDEIGIEFMSTAHSIEAIPFVDTLVKTHKIASPFLINQKFINKIASTKKNILLSTGSLETEDGMAKIRDVANAIYWLAEKHVLDFVILLHCVSKYPCLDNHLERINDLHCFDIPVGFSDHSKTIDIKVKVPVLEKHIMLHGQQAIDAPVSLYPDEFKHLVKNIREMEKA